ncbi:MAG: penicillin-binding transpeptidase domain-containing protein [Acidimicrobiales bacterium]
MIDDELGDPPPLRRTKSAPSGDRRTGSGRNGPRPHAAAPRKPTRPARGGVGLLEGADELGDRAPARTGAPKAAKGGARKAAANGSRPVTATADGGADRATSASRRGVDRSWERLWAADEGAAGDTEHRSRGLIRIGDLDELDDFGDFDDIDHFDAADFDPASGRRSGPGGRSGAAGLFGRDDPFRGDRGDRRDEPAPSVAKQRGGRSAPAKATPGTGPARSGAATTKGRARSKPASKAQAAAKGAGQPKVEARPKVEGAEKGERPRPRRARTGRSPRQGGSADATPSSRKRTRAVPTGTVRTGTVRGGTVRGGTVRGGTVRGGTRRRPPVSRGPYRLVSSKRLTGLVLVALLGFIVLAAKLANLQAMSPDRYRQQAKEQRVSAEVLPATRGAIVDRNGEPLVTTVTRKTIYTDPATVPRGQAPAMAAALAPLLQVDAATLQQQLESPGNFAYLARKVSDETARAVEALRLPGIYSLDEATRLKPAEDLALSLVGRVDTENVGISGVEAAYNESLTGTPGELVRERSLTGDRTIPSAGQRIEPAVPGSTVTLTLDRTLQQMTERAVADGMRAVWAKAGTAIVMDTVSGEILALASLRADETTGAVSNDDQNRAITTTYDPGSVMKVVTMAGAIETGLVNAATVRQVPTEVTFADSTFVDDSRFEPEAMTVTDILARSSNVGTMLLAKDLGSKALAEGLASFGFGTATGIGLAHEEPGFVLPRARWSDTSLPTIAIGQAINATPLQVLAAYNTVANGGEYVSPSVVRSVVSSDNEDVSRVVPNRRRVISTETSAQLRAMLGAVVTQGTGSQAAVEGYEVAGKTGTAWKWRNETEEYGQDGDRDYLATFVGFAPANEPRFSIIVVLDEPQSAIYTGGAAAAPVFSAIAQQALLSKDIAPEAPGWVQRADGANLRARPARAATPPPVVVLRKPPPVAATDPVGAAVGASATSPAPAADAATNPGATGTAPAPATVAPPTANSAAPPTAESAPSSPTDGAPPSVTTATPPSAADAGATASPNPAPPDSAAPPNPAAPPSAEPAPTNPSAPSSTTPGSPAPGSPAPAAQRSTGDATVQPVPAGARVATPPSAGAGTATPSAPGPTAAVPAGGG